VTLLVIAIIAGIGLACLAWFGQRIMEARQAGADAEKKREAQDALNKVKLAKEAGDLAAGDAPAVRRERLRSDARE
jgi:hypothetical protein